jgi:aryl-alcohol dehydrogenase-like predicted oxidoreductase
MKQVILPNSNLQVSRLSFGTASLHHVITSRARQQLLYSVLNSGISHFDTSPYYGFGLAESELGALMHRSDTSITVATKVGIYPPSISRYPLPILLLKAMGKFIPSMTKPEVDWSVARADLSLNQSLKRLRREYVDILFLHEPSQKLLNCDEFLVWQEKLVKNGKVLHFGLAGPSESFVDCIDSYGSLAEVLQVKDSLEGLEADQLIKSMRMMQFTYGYFSSASRNHLDFSPVDVLAGALARNRQGSIVISTRNIGHLNLMASIAEGLGN